MSRNELIERAKFGDALKKYSIKSIKDKFLIIDSLKADFTIRFLCEVLNISRFGYYKWKIMMERIITSEMKVLPTKFVIFIEVSRKCMVIIWL